MEDVEVEVCLTAEQLKVQVWSKVPHADGKVRRACYIQLDPLALHCPPLD